MKTNFKNFEIFFLLLFIIIVGVSCEENNGENSNLAAITDEYNAKFAVDVIGDFTMRNLIQELDNGELNAVTIMGISGEAKVNGSKIYRKNLSCGNDCIKSEHDTELTITFNNFENQNVTLSGTITYSDKTWSRQSGLNYSSGGKLQCSGSNIEIMWDYGSGSGRKDEISFNASSSTGERWSGWCTPKNGIKYNF